MHIRGRVVRVRFPVAAGLLTNYSVLGGHLTGYCFQQYWPRLDNRGGNRHAPWALLEINRSIHTR